METSAPVIGDTIIALDSVLSTNKTAADMMGGDGLRHGTVVLAHEQTAGRGQRGRTWYSGRGKDLTFSVVLKPVDLRADAQFALAQVAALGVHDTVAAALVGEVRIKWPNDVLVERRKVAGILIENELEGERVAQSIMGIGLNVNQRELEAGLVATSLALESGRDHDRMAVLHELLGHLRRRYTQWETDPVSLSAEYAARLWARGRWADLLLDGEALSARPVDVDPYGRLLVEHADGRVAAYGLDRLRFAAR